MIETTVSSADLVLSAPGTGSVVVDDQLQILSTPSSDDASVDPSAPTDGAKLYVKAPGVGKTGIYYVNSSSTRAMIPLLVSQQLYFIVINYYLLYQVKQL